jgi:hypothetical protein
MDRKFNGDKTNSIKENTMKRSILVFLSVATLTGLLTLTTTIKHHAGTLPVVHAQSGCSNATLTGNYVVVYTGFNSKRNNKATELPIAAVGIATFDGAGNLSLSYSSSFNGQIGTTSTPDLGTYTVNSDCTLTAADPVAGNTWSGGIVGGGSEWDVITTSTGYTTTMVGKKQ